MTTPDKKHYSYRQLILFLASGLLIFLSLMIAMATTLVASQQVKHLLFIQGLEWGQSLARNSVVALLYEDAEIIQESVKTLMDSGMISHMELVTLAGDAIMQQGGKNNRVDAYPQPHKTPHEVHETRQAWFYSFSVSTVLKLSASTQGEQAFMDAALLEEQQDEVLGYVHVTLSKQSLRRIEREIFINNFAIALALSVFLVLLLLSLANRLFSPLEKLATVMGTTSRGSWKLSDNLSGPAEIRSISQAYNRMIMALKRREDEILEREQNLAVTLNSIGDAVITTDENGLVSRMNPVAEQLTGWLLEEVQGRPLKKILRLIDASTREVIDNPVDKVIATGETIHLSNHTTLISRDGTEYQIADSAAPICDQEGKILGMVLVFNDVTESYELRMAAARSDAQVRLLLDSTSEAIYGIDILGKCTFVNKSCLKILGYDKVDELLGHEMHELIQYKFLDGTDYPSEESKIHQSFRDGLEVNNDSEVLWRKDGSSFAAEYWSHPIIRNEVCEGAVVTFMDITAKRLADDTIRRSQKMAALGTLTGGIAHDYNNMLGVVLGYAELLQSRLVDQPELAKFAYEIHHAGERGAKLTQKLLAFTHAKISHANRMDINILLREEQNMLEKTLTVRIELVFDLAEKLWPSWLDSGDLEDAIVNLTINAMHAIEGQGRLTIQTRNESISEMDAKILRISPGEYIILSISDTGCGMDKATREKIFDPFFSTKGEMGTGLGLSQVYGFMQRSKGTIKVYSEVGHGSRFLLYFPRFHSSTDVQQVVEASNDVNVKGSESILVVDDEAALLKLTAQILNEHGYRVICATSGKQALEILENEEVDLLLSDVIMPAMNGFQLAILVQQKYPRMKIQLQSGFTDNRHGDLSGDSLQKNLLQKPVMPLVLLRRVREIFDQ